MGYTFHTLDVFTTEAYCGNPLAVVLDAEGLDGDAMQAIAREFNLSETVFVLPADNPAHTAKVRIFTPSVEMPFAGHPTVGTAALLAINKYGTVEREEDAIIVLEEGIGPVRVGVRLRPDEAAFAEFDSARLPEQAGEPAPTDRIAAALGLAPNEIGFENHRPVCLSAGIPFTFVPVRNLEAIARVRIVSEHWRAGFDHAGNSAAYIYCRETEHRSSAFHARAFAPDLIVGEDPATGSAAAAFAGVVRRFDTPPDGTHMRIIEQGYEMNRPSEIALELEMDAGQLHSVRIGGHAVPVMQGVLEA